MKFEDCLTAQTKKVLNPRATTPCSFGMGIKLHWRVLFGSEKHPRHPFGDCSNAIMTRLSKSKRHPQASQ